MRRSPCGERGLKLGVSYDVDETNVGRSPCGERGLKCQLRRRGRVNLARRSPCGERGLKWLPWPSADSQAVSLPVRGAWIEIFFPPSVRPA